MDTFLLTNAFLIDGRGGEPLPEAYVVVSDGRIKEVGTGPKDLPGAKNMDLRGMTLLPGLIDAHVHVGNIELSLTDTVALPPAVYVYRAGLNLETDLDMGFTTLRDAAGLDVGFKAAIDQGLIRGPRLCLSTTPLVQSGPENPMPRNSLGVYPEICDGPDEVRRAARRTLGRGADQIKIFADGEVLAQQPSDQARPGQWKFTADEMRAAVETAEAAGTYVMAHAYGPRAIRNCLEAGVRSIEHGNLLDAETAEMMARKGAFLVPTLTIYDLLLEDEYGILNDKSREKLALVGEKGRQALKTAYQAGVKIASGSDCLGPFQKFKGRELAIKAEIMSPMQAIVSATKTNAELLGLSDVLGTLEAGKYADLIVVRGNPLENTSLFEKGLETVLLVMKAGRIYKDRLG